MSYTISCQVTGDACCAWVFAQCHTVVIDEGHLVVAHQPVEEDQPLFC